MQKELKDSQAGASEAKKVSFSVKDLDNKLASSWRKMKKLIEDALVASRKLNDGSDAVVNAEITITDLQIKQSDSDKKPERLDLELHDAR